MPKAAYVDAITLKMGSGNYWEVYSYLQENAGMFPSLIMRVDGGNGVTSYFTAIPYTVGIDSKGFLFKQDKEFFIDFLGEEKAQEMFSILDTLLLLED